MRISEAPQLQGAAVVLLVFAASMPAGATGSAQPPLPNAIVAENALVGTTAWNRRYASGASIEGYTSQESVASGDLLELHVSTNPAAAYRVEIYRLGWYGGDGGRLIACLPACETTEQGVPQPVPQPDPATGEARAEWPVTDSVTVPATWTTGYYLAELVIASGRLAGMATRLPFIVRSSSGAASQILVVAPVNTWEAYNAWDGNSLYVGTTGHHAFKVSFDRPGVTDRSGLLWEYPLLRFLERGGYDLAYTTDVDVDNNPSELLQHRLVIVAGHSEYWSGRIRNAFDAAKADGTNLMFAGANAGYWQIRYEDNRRTIVAYKEMSNLDPVADLALKTARFRDLTPPRPECRLTGVEYEYGAWGLPPQGYAVNPAALADPWFAGTNFTPSTVLPGLVAGEWDDAMPACLDTPETVLFSFDGSVLGKPSADAVRYVAPSGAIIFATGSHGFSLGLDSDPYTPPGLENPGLQRFMSNALAAMTLPAAPLSVNVSSVGARLQISVTRSADPRVQYVDVYRHPGSALLDPRQADSRSIRECRLSRGACFIPTPKRGVYRFAAVAVDLWGGESAPRFSRPVAMGRLP